MSEKAEERLEAEMRRVPIDFFERFSKFDDDAKRYHVSAVAPYRGR